MAKLVTTFLTTLLALALPAEAATMAEVLADPERLEADRERDKRDHPEVVLELLQVGPGDRVADIFAGAGYYSELLGRLVAPDGQVLMHNNQAYIQFVGDALVKRFQKRDLPVITRHDREVEDLDLGESSLDAAMIIMSYHDIYHVDKGWPRMDVPDFMGQIVKALKPGGRFLLVDHAAAPGSEISTAQDLHRIDEAFVKRDVEGYGLKLVAGSDVLRNPQDDHSLHVFDPAIRGRTDRFILVFEKPAQGESTP